MLRDYLFSTLHEEMLRNKDIYLLTADMGAWGLEKIMQDIPDRCLNVGVSEQNLINVAGGLALGGKKVFCYAIACFLIYRAFDQIRTLVENKLNFCLIGAGPDKLYGMDGPSHWALYDKPMIQSLGITVSEPRTEFEVSNSVYHALHGNTVYIRMVVK